MDNTILPSLIALIGVVLSVIIAFLSTRLSIRSEIRKLESSIIQNYSTKILEERNKRYPEIYFEISQIAKNIVANPFDVGRPHLDLNSLKDFILKFDEINSRHSVFFSSATGSVSHKLRMFIYEIINEISQSPSDINNILNSEKQKQFLNAIGKLEVALKKDLGVFVIEFQDAHNKLSASNYTELKYIREKN